MKPWISANTWRVVRTLAPMRRLAARAAADAERAAARCVLLAWAATVHAAFTPGRSPGGGGLGWAAAAMRPAAAAAAAGARRVAAGLWHAAGRLSG
eukprot:8271423-Lingulodinium_polyedra.AAC.1